MCDERSELQKVAYCLSRYLVASLLTDAASLSASALEGLSQAEVKRRLFLFRSFRPSYLNAYVYVIGMSQVLANVMSNFDTRWCEGFRGGGVLRAAAAFGAFIGIVIAGIFPMLTEGLLEVKGLSTKQRLWLAKLVVGNVLGVMVVASVL